MIERGQHLTFAQESAANFRVEQAAGNEFQCDVLVVCTVCSRSANTTPIAPTPSTLSTRYAPTIRPTLTSGQSPYPMLLQQLASPMHRFSACVEAARKMRVVSALARNEIVYRFGRQLDGFPRTVLPAAENARDPLASQLLGKPATCKTPVAFNGSE